MVRVLVLRTFQKDAPPESRFPSQIVPIIHAFFGLFRMYFWHLWLRHNRCDTSVPPFSKVFFFLFEAQMPGFLAFLVVTHIGETPQYPRFPRFFSFSCYLKHKCRDFRHLWLTLIGQTPQYPRFLRVFFLFEAQNAWIFCICDSQI